MKILKIKINGLPLYDGGTLELSFNAIQRVQNNHLDSVYRLFGNIYINTTEAFIGINASGKTTVLKVISFVDMLLKAFPLSQEFVPQILGENIKTIFDIDFYADGSIYHLKSVLVKLRKKDGNSAIQILDEELWKKSANSKVRKNNFLDFKDIAPIRIRDGSSEYLPEDVSIMIAVNKQLKEYNMFVDLARFTNFNFFIPDEKAIPTEIISMLDPSIEYIKFETIKDKQIIKLKFNQREELALSYTELNAYLSSGTIKGIRVFLDTVTVLKDGGYLIVDEIENHFNRELVSSLLRLFMNKRTNPKGATIIFSTHYPELLDEIKRNDAVFITKRTNQGLVVKNLNSLLKRNDIKKSEIYQSNYLGGTAPKFSALNAFQKSIIKELVE